MASGEDHVSTTDTVVLVHALGSSSRAWEAQEQGWCDRYRVVAPDLPGHGEAGGRFTLEGAVEAVHAATARSGAPVHVVGISAGAVVALRTCLDHPDAVAGLVLSAGLAHPPRTFAVQRAVTRVLPETLLARTMAGTYAGGRPEHTASAREDFLRCGKRTFVAGLDALATLDVRARLHEVAVPTLVVCGAKDRANVPLSRELAAGIPGARLTVVPGATHLWNRQQPETFNRVVGGFLDETSTRRPAAG
jgi:3-oxoadipate enol-lactonase